MTRQRRIWLIRLAAVLAVLAISGLCASVVVEGLKLSAPAPRAIGAPPQNLAGAEPVQIPSASGSLLRGWWVSGNPGGGAVILMHGVWSSRLSMVRRAVNLRAQGFSVLLFDFQAHGESPGQHITYGHLEALDAAAAVDFARHRAPGEKIGAIGVSLGGAAALLGPHPLALDALVLESVYPDIDSGLGNRLRIGLGPVMGSLFTPILVPSFELLLPPLIGVTAQQLRPIDRIGSVKAPLLMASGDADMRTPAAETDALFARAPQPKQLWMMPGAAHVDLEAYDPRAYWRVVQPFLTRHLQR